MNLSKDAKLEQTGLIDYTKPGDFLMQLDLFNHNKSALLVMDIVDAISGLNWEKASQLLLTYELDSKGDAASEELGGLINFALNLLQSAPMDYPQVQHEIEVWDEWLINVANKWLNESSTFKNFILNQLLRVVEDKYFNADYPLVYRSAIYVRLHQLEKAVKAIVAVRDFETHKCLMSQLSQALRDDDPTAALWVDAYRISELNEEYFKVNKTASALFTDYWSAFEASSMDDAVLEDSDFIYWVVLFGPSFESVFTCWPKLVIKNDVFDAVIRIKSSEQNNTVNIEAREALKACHQNLLTCYLHQKAN